MWLQRRHRKEESVMKNELFTIGPFTVYGYGLMIAVGILAAYWVGEYRAKKCGLEVDHVFHFVIWCVVGGFLGAKILYWITDIKNILDNPRIMLQIADGYFPPSERWMGSIWRDYRRHSFGNAVFQAEGTEISCLL